MYLTKIILFLLVMAVTHSHLVCEFNFSFCLYQVPDNGIYHVNYFVFVFGKVLGGTSHYKDLYDQQA